MFDCTFFENRYCFIWPLFNESQQQLDKKNKKMQNYKILVFFRKKSKKAIKYKMKKLNRFVRSSIGGP